MKDPLESLKAVLAVATPIALKTQLSRLVPFIDLVAYDPPNWLFTSGKPNRYNPAGIHCAYFAEARDVAQTEYDAMWQGRRGADQPVITYTAEVSLTRVLNLTRPALRRALGLSDKELYKTWRRATRPTLTQLLGQAVTETKLFSAIRYPSKAAVAAGQPGINLVIFRDCVRSPESVRILGPSAKALQEWP
ncbi:MAG: RES domain-containing protein [Verrucomicrobiota bacterium]